MAEDGEGIISPPARMFIEDVLSTYFINFFFFNPGDGSDESSQGRMMTLSL